MTTIAAGSPIQVFAKHPNKDALLVHFVPSHLKEPGVQALVVLSVESSGVAGLPTPSLPRHVYFQVAPKGGSFVDFGEAKNACLLSLELYLQILGFFAEEYPRIESKIKHELRAMREENLPVLIEPGLGFIGHGYCVYKHQFNGETVIDIRAESKNKEDIFYVHLTTSNSSNKHGIPLYGECMKQLANNLPTLKKLTAFLYTQHNYQPSSIQQ